MKKCLYLLFVLMPALVIAFASCSTSSGDTAIRSKKSRLFALKDTDMDGEPVQVLKSQFGLDIVPLRTNVSIRFGTNGQLFVTFDEQSLKPKDIMLRKTDSSGEFDESVWDMNADGIPDMRLIKRENAHQVFYRGNWYYGRNVGTNFFIILEGKPMTLFFDGTAWRPNTNQISSPQNGSTSPAVSLRQ